MIKIKGNGGRPSKYETKVKINLDKITQWVSEGKTEASIAQSCGVSHDSFIEYKKQFSELIEAIKKGNDIVDGTVENALLKRALGFDFDEVTQEKKGSTVTKTKVTRKHIVADVGAIAFWLKNRRPDIWRDKQDIEHSGDLGLTSINIKFGDKSKRVAHIEKDPVIVDGGALKEDNDL